MEKEKVINYLAERRDYYKRQKESEERKLDMNPALHIEYLSKQKAFEEAKYDVSYVL